jgi:hypothetical protein
VSGVAPLCTYRIRRGGPLALHSSPTTYVGGALTKLDKETSDAFAARVGRKVRSAQRSGGVSTEQIAADTGIDVERIEALIAGTATDEPPSSELWPIAGSLKVEPGDLFDGIRWIHDGAGSDRYEIDE